MFGAYVSRRSIRSSGRRSWFLIFFSGNENLREWFVRYFDVGIGIICLEQIVEFWQIFFDEIIFQIERFALILDDKKIDFVGFGQHILLPDGIGRKILSDSFFEIFRFSDIENYSLFIFEKVDSWIRWDMGNGGKVHENKDC